jgi:hypothetical protein
MRWIGVRIAGVVGSLVMAVFAPAEGAEGEAVESGRDNDDPAGKQLPMPVAAVS